MQVHVKLGLKAASIELEEASTTVASIHEEIRKAFELSADSQMRILCKGKAITGELATPLSELPLSDGTKLMVMESKVADAKAVDTAKRERMRGFEEDDNRLRQGGTGGKAAGGVTAYRSRDDGPSFKFHGTQALPHVPPGAKPPVAAAQERLRELSTDPAILAIMKKHKWNVGLLREMPPEGQVGVSASCLMGLNKNKGEEILLRLRTDDWQGLRPYDSVIPVLLHELTHNVHSDHDDDFKALCSQLGREYREHKSAGRALGGGGETARASTGGVSSTDDADRGHVLGGGDATSMAEARARAFGYAPPPSSLGKEQAVEAMDVSDPAVSGTSANAGGEAACACGACGFGAVRCDECEPNANGAA